MKNNFEVKRFVFGLAAALVLSIGLFAADASAQNSRMFKVEVPFEFVVNGQTYPAATYKIGRLTAADPDTLVLNSSAGKTLLVVRTQRNNFAEPTDLSTLIFSRQGETYFLDVVRASGDKYESRLPIARPDRSRFQLAKAQIVSLRIK
jgi:hypothetical protein